MPSRKSRRRRARPTTSKGVKVTAAQSCSGSPATTVSVEVHPSVVRQEMGAEHVEAVVAHIPVEERGRVRWSEERLPKVADQPSSDATGGKQTYATTHYGRTESHRLGVRVKLSTDRGEVVARPGEAQRVRESDKPEDEEGS